MTKIPEQIILEAVRTKPQNAEELNEIKRRILRASKIKNEFPNTAVLLKAYHNLVKKNKIKPSDVLARVLTKRAVRTLSGVAIVTALTKPFPCPGECVYCPNEKSMPKSYISDEPAAARALMLHFDPYEQVARRLESLAANGHPIEKIELIVKGGTWNAYPLFYQYWFILRCFEAANLSLRAPSGAKQSPNGKIASVATLSRNDINKLRKQLTVAQKKNETAKHRIIGLTLETRPDHIDEKNILIMRELGCTRVELGVQTISEKILKKMLVLPFISKIGAAENQFGVLENEFSTKLWEKSLKDFIGASITIEPTFWGPKQKLINTGKRWPINLATRLTISIEGGGITVLYKKSGTEQRKKTKLTDLLRCPLCKKLNITRFKNKIICKFCRARYPIVNSVYVLIEPKLRKRLYPNLEK